MSIVGPGENGYIKIECKFLERVIERLKNKKDFSVKFSKTEIIILLYLIVTKYDEPEPWTIKKKEIADETGIDPSAVTRGIDALCNIGILGTTLVPKAKRNGLKVAYSFAYPRMYDDITDLL